MLPQDSILSYFKEDNTHCFTILYEWYNKDISIKDCILAHKDLFIGWLLYPNIASFLLDLELYPTFNEFIYSLYTDKIHIYVVKILLLYYTMDMQKIVLLKGACNSYIDSNKIKQYTIECKEIAHFFIERQFITHPPL